MVYYEYRYRYVKNKVHSGGVAYMHLKECVADAKRLLSWNKKVLGGVVEIWEIDSIYDGPHKGRFVRYVVRSDTPKKKTKKSGNDYGIKGDWKPFEGM